MSPEDHSKQVKTGDVLSYAMPLTGQRALWPTLPYNEERASDNAQDAST